MFLTGLTTIERKKACLLTYAIHLLMEYEAIQTILERLPKFSDIF